MDPNSNFQSLAGVELKYFDAFEPLPGNSLEADQCLGGDRYKGTPRMGLWPLTLQPDEEMKWQEQQYHGTIIQMCLGGVTLGTLGGTVFELCYWLEIAETKPHPWTPPSKSLSFICK